MARLIKCPRCQSVLDVTKAPAEATVRCHGCEAMVRVPSPPLTAILKEAVQDDPELAPLPPKKPAKASMTRQTPLFRKMSNSRGAGGGGRPGRDPIEVGGARGNPLMMVGVGVGVLALILVGVVVATKSKNPAASTAKPKRGARGVPPSPPSVIMPAPPEPPPGAPPVIRSSATPSPNDTGWWDRAMQDLRSGSFDEGTPAGAVFSQIRSMGKGAYPPLLKYIEHEDVGFGKAAVQVLIQLTGKTTRMPNESNRTEIRKEWETNLASIP